MDSPNVANHSDFSRWTDDYVQREPAKAVISAFAAGILLPFLPLAAITAGVVRLARALLRPALLFLGLVKAGELCGCISSRQKTARQ